MSEVRLLKKAKVEMATQALTIRCTRPHWILSFICTTSA